ncbi:transposase [Streptomyces sp. NPDC048142]|uniref:IS110 family transposase n=1 Tax=Streptomyces sp. NPDC048142 TaxID=3365501 RepID=UPI0037167D41
MARLQDSKDEVFHLRSAGVDLGKRFLLACVRTPSTKRAGSWSLETERFGTTTAEVRRLLAWLLERRVEVVVMEATSDYWRPVYYLLQPHLNLMLVNPAHLKGIRGRKTDPSDAARSARRAPGPYRDRCGPSRTRVFALSPGNDMAVRPQAFADVRSAGPHPLMHSTNRAQHGKPRPTASGDRLHHPVLECAGDGGAWTRHRRDDQKPGAVI